MSTFKRLGLSVLLFCTLTAAAGAGTASADFAATGAFTFDVNGGSTRLTINGTSNYVQCSSSQATGTAVASATLSFRLVFGGTCVTQAGTSASVSCASPTGSFRLFHTPGDPSNHNTTSGDGQVRLTGSCTIVIGSNLCTITAPSASSLPWTVPGTGTAVDGDNEPPEATLTIPAPTTVPFTATGSFCGLIGVPSSGTSTFATPAGASTLVYTQTGGTDIDIVTP